MANPQLIRSIQTLQEQYQLGTGSINEAKTEAKLSALGEVIEEGHGLEVRGREARHLRKALAQQIVVVRVVYAQVALQANPMLASLQGGSAVQASCTTTDFIVKYSEKHQG